MVEDDQLQALNQESGAETAVDTTPVSEEQTSPEVESESQETQPETLEATDEGKKGANARIRELNARAKEAEAKAQSLAQKLAELTRGVDTPQTQPVIPSDPLPPLVKEGEELSAEELNKRIVERDNLLLQRSMQYSQFIAAQNKVLDTINREARIVVKKYAMLNPDSESYNPKLSDAVTKAAEAYVKQNPTASLKKFVDNMMEPYQQSVEREVGNQQKAITQQVAQAAVRPTSIKQVEKTAKDKSIAELEAELGIYQS